MKIIVAALALFVLSGCTFAGSSGAAEPTSVRSTSTSTPSTPTPAPPPIVDSGPTTMANGTAEALADGTVRYVVAEGDVGGVICDRFGLSWLQLQYEDERGGVTCFTSVFPGDVLNLSSARDGVVPE